jgi:2-methylcitrate dehydratase PrpD
MRGVIAGYEISSRMGGGVNPAHYKFWNTTGTIGTFGAAVSSAGFGR